MAEEIEIKEEEKEDPTQTETPEETPSLEQDKIVARKRVGQKAVTDHIIIGSHQINGFSQEVETKNLGLKSLQKITLLSDDADENTEKTDEEKALDESVLMAITSGENEKPVAYFMTAGTEDDKVVKLNMSKDFLQSFRSQNPSVNIPNGESVNDNYESFEVDRLKLSQDLNIEDVQIRTANENFAMLFSALGMQVMDKENHRAVVRNTEHPFNVAINKSCLDLANIAEKDKTAWQKKIDLPNEGSAYDTLVAMNIQASKNDTLQLGSKENPQEKFYKTNLSAQKGEEKENHDLLFRQKNGKTFVWLQIKGETSNSIKRPKWFEVEYAQLEESPNSTTKEIKNPSLLLGLKEGSSHTRVNIDMDYAENAETLKNLKNNILKSEFERQLPSETKSKPKKREVGGETFLSYSRAKTIGAQIVSYDSLPILGREIMEKQETLENQDVKEASAFVDNTTKEPSPVTPDPPAPENNTDTIETEKATEQQVEPPTPQEKTVEMSGVIDNQPATDSTTDGDDTRDSSATLDTTQTEATTENSTQTSAIETTKETSNSEEQSVSNEEPKSNGNDDKKQESKDKKGSKDDKKKDKKKDDKGKDKKGKNDKLSGSLLGIGALLTVLSCLLPFLAIPAMLCFGGLVINEVKPYFTEASSLFGRHNDKKVKLTLDQQKELALQKIAQKEAPVQNKRDNAKQLLENLQNKRKEIKQDATLSDKQRRTKLKNIDKSIMKTNKLINDCNTKLNKFGLDRDITEQQFAKKEHIVKIKDAKYDVKKNGKKLNKEMVELKKNLDNKIAEQEEKAQQIRDLQGKIAQYDSLGDTDNKKRTQKELDEATRLKGEIDSQVAGLSTQLEYKRTEYQQTISKHYDELNAEQDKVTENDKQIEIYKNKKKVFDKELKAQNTSEEIDYIQQQLKAIDEDKTLLLKDKDKLVKKLDKSQSRLEDKHNKQTNKTVVQQSNEDVITAQFDLQHVKNSIKPEAGKKLLEQKINQNRKDVLQANVSKATENKAKYDKRTKDLENNIKEQEQIAKDIQSKINIQSQTNLTSAERSILSQIDARLKKTYKEHFEELETNINKVKELKDKDKLSEEETKELAELQEYLAEDSKTCPVNKDLLSLQSELSTTQSQVKDLQKDIAIAKEKLDEAKIPELKTKSEVTREVMTTKALEVKSAQDSIKDAKNKVDMLKKTKSETPIIETNNYTLPPEKQEEQEKTLTYQPKKTPSETKAKGDEGRSL